MNLDLALQTFFVESRELLEDMETALLGVLQEDDRSDAINAIFRAAHTIKGSAGLFGLDGIVAFTHVVESVLDRVREEMLEIDEALVALLLECRDHMGLLVETVAAGTATLDADAADYGQTLLQALRVRLGGDGPHSGKPGDLSSAAQSAAAVMPPADELLQRATRADGSGADHWQISLRFGPDVLRNGMDPLSFIRYLGKLGRIAGIVTLPQALPTLQQMDPESCYLGLEIALLSDASKASIEGAFEFVLDDCAVRILPPHSRLEQYIELMQQGGDEAARIGEMLLRCGTLTERELAQALLSQRQTTEPQPLGEILVEQGAVQPAVVDAALVRQKQAKDNRVQENQSVRVDADKLDHLINLVGELITAAASAQLASQSTRSAELLEANLMVSSLVEEVRDSALQLRMVKIAGTFSRFRRVVHDVSREIGKPIELIVRGEDTELDKTVIEKIGDPLTHLVRNAMDHGIEAAELRLARGKPAQGTLTLNARHDSGSVVIEVSDDGGGLNRERILAKALERGLIEPGRVLSEQETFALIFEPGFSTAEQVTNLSGRGVGMDVVKRNITALRGTVSVASQAGGGTTVSVRLPLTLAIINGFQIAVGNAVFVIPLEMVDECIEFSSEDGRDFTNLRGQVLPFLRLREFFALGGQPGPRENVVVIRDGAQRVGLVVDRLLGEAQTVIKPLSRLFDEATGISGSSIQGNGEVALILDMPALMRRVMAERLLLET
jgi:two-component system chemotaxis sensor kinase CheA